jgi:hypothetical protein
MKSRNMSKHWQNPLPGSRVTPVTSFMSWINIPLALASDATFAFSLGVMFFIVNSFFKVFVITTVPDKLD